MAERSAQKVVAKALWADGNNRIGHRPWESVRNAYMAEAGHAIAALKANGFVVVHPDDTREDCPDRWVCCLHPMTQEERDRA